MIDWHKEINGALNTICPTYYEAQLTKEAQLPCMSYMEVSNIDLPQTGDTLGYDRVSYQISIWSKRISQIQEIASQVDVVMREIGFTRTSSAELFDPNSSMIHKALTYQVIALEDY